MVIFGLFFILCVPLALVVLSLLIKRQRFEFINALGHLAIFLTNIGLMLNMANQGKGVSLFNFFYLDILSVFFIFTISVVNFACALYSLSFIKKNIADTSISERKSQVYYLLFNLFAFTMFFVTTVNNLGMLWVAIEMTTLVSAFLVGFYNTKESVEAAWKYIIICSVGIIFALLGTILFYYAMSLSAGVKSLNWTDMLSCAGSLDKNIIKVAFIFIIVGYGTKAGLAPMHTWLPDAHSQAIAPISALLSGVLLKTAIYAILRFSIITNKAIGSQFSGTLFILLGIISLAVSCGFIMVQKDLKRLLAYSSIEHIGIISIGFGLGTGIAILGALLHIFNHAVTKSLMFFGAGNIVSHYKSHNMNSIKGVIKTMPFTGIMFLIGTFALTGFPPFSVFISELIIIIAAFVNGSYLVASLLLLFIVLIFSAIIYHFGRILFGNRPKDMVVAKEPLSSKLTFLFLLIPICCLGILIPWILQANIFSSLQMLIKGN